MPSNDPAANFGFYTFRIIDGVPVFDIFVDVDVPKDEAAARAAAEAYVAARRGDREPPRGFTIAAVHPFPEET